MRTNLEIAKVLDEIGSLLEIQDADPFRIRAYHRGAESILKQKQNVAELVASGDVEALQEIPGIGESLAGVISEYVRTGKSQLLQRLIGKVTPEDVFEHVPGIGSELAERLVRELGIRTLEELEQCAHDGRLAKLKGFGKKRVEAVRAILAGMLSGFAQRRVSAMATNTLAEPSVALLLEVDAEYRDRAGKGDLKKIAPRRFNPKKLAWLPILHVDKDGWAFTALFSNTARAHELGKTHDWVFIFFEKNGVEGQRTVVTETHGPQDGMRVVRGRED